MNKAQIAKLIRAGNTLQKLAITAESTTEQFRLQKLVDEIDQLVIEN